MKYYRTFNVLVAVIIVAFPALVWLVFIKHDGKPTVDAAPLTAQAQPADATPTQAAPSGENPLLAAMQTERSDPPAAPESDMLTEAIDNMQVKEYPADVEESLLGEPIQVSSAPSSPSTPITGTGTADDPIVVVSGSRPSSTTSSSSSGGSSSSSGSLSTSSSTLGSTSGGGGSGSVDSSEGSSDASNSTAADATAASDKAGETSSAGEPSSTGGTNSDEVTTPSGSGTGGGAPIPEDLYEPHNIAAIFLSADDIAHGMPYTQALKNMLRYDAFWYAQSIANRNPQVWRTIRDKYPDRLAMYYISTCTTKKGSGDGYLDFEYIEKFHPEWYLLKDEIHATEADYRNPDKRIRWNPDDPTSDNYYRYFLDVGNPEFQTWAVNEFLKKLNPVSGINARIPYTGLLAENVSLSNIAYSWRQTYPNWKHASNPPEWSRNFCLYLDKIKAALNLRGYIVIANSSVNYESSSKRIRADFADLLDSTDGIAREAPFGQSTQPLTGGEKWELSMQTHEEVLDAGLYDWWVYYPNLEDPAKDEQRFLYVYCSFLLIKNDKLSLFGTNNSQSIPWYEEYTLPLGNPVGDRYQRQDCWMRDYQYGKIAVNPNETECTITLEEDSYMLNWSTKRKITQLTLEPLSATILLPTSYPLN